MARLCSRRRTRTAVCREGHRGDTVPGDAPRPADAERPSVLPILPDGEHLVFFAAGPVVHTGVYLASRAGGDAIKLVTADTAGALTSSGHLLFVRGGTLYAQPLDQRRLVISGEPTVVAELIVLPARKGRLFRLRRPGLIVYRAGSQLKDQLVWLDRTGTPTRVALEPDPTGLFNPAVSRRWTRPAATQRRWQRHLAGGRTHCRGDAGDRSQCERVVSGLVLQTDGGSRSRRIGRACSILSSSPSPPAPPELLVSSSDLKIPT